MVFGQAVGQWLRRNGANGLIFPSARSNAFNTVVSGTPVEWGGWNLVVYSGADEPVSDNLFGRMVTGRDQDHDHIWVDHTAEGTERGSFINSRTGGVQPARLRLEETGRCGIRHDDVVSAVTGTRIAALSHGVNVILEKQRDTGDLWYQDAAYLQFVNCLEQQWRVRVAKPA